MENREQVLNEYFKLRVLLNRGNIEANSITDITFEIAKASPNQLEFRASTSNLAPKRFLCLSIWESKREWRTGDYSGLDSLEEYLRDSLNLKFTKVAKDPLLMTSFELTEISRLVTAELRGLGIS